MQVVKRSLIRRYVFPIQSIFCDSDWAFWIVVAFAGINKIYLNGNRWTKRKAPKPQVIGSTWLTYFLVQWSPSKVLNNLSRLLQRCAQNLDRWFSVMGCILVLATLPCIPTFTYYTNTHGSDTDHIFWDVRRRMILCVGGLTFYAHVDMSRFIHRKMLWGGGNPSSWSHDRLIPRLQCILCLRCPGGSLEGATWGPMAVAPLNFGLDGLEMKRKKVWKRLPSWTNSLHVPNSVFYGHLRLWDQEKHSQCNGNQTTFEQAELGWCFSRCHVCC